jgi:single-strand DNA-binding protein
MPTPIHLVGNLTDDPELRFTASGTAVVKFSVAVNRQRKDQQTGKWEDAGTDFHRVTAWQYLAENVAATLQKGMRVVVIGDLRQDHWKDEKSGENRSAWSVHALAVGPDLTFATAKVTKTAKTGGGQAAPDDPWNTASKQRPAEPAAAGGGHLPGQWPTPQPGYSAEPPF